MDFVFVALILGFFALMLALVKGCADLAENRELAVCVECRARRDRGGYRQMEHLPSNYPKQPNKMPSRLLTSSEPVLECLNRGGNCLWRIRNGGANAAATSDIDRS